MLGAAPDGVPKLASQMDQSNRAINGLKLRNRGQRPTSLVLGGRSEERPPPTSEMYALESHAKVCSKGE